MCSLRPRSCSDGYLRIYLKGQEQENAYDKPDYELCGKTLPQTIVSYGPRLVMVFSSGNVHGGRFKASYKFETGGSVLGCSLFLLYIYIYMSICGIIYAFKEIFIHLFTHISIN